MSEIMKCTMCGKLGTPKIKNKGSVLVCLLLFFFYVIPGIIYLAWMVSGRVEICPHCKKKNTMIPFD